MKSIIQLIGTLIIFALPYILAILAIIIGIRLIYFFIVNSKGNAFATIVFIIFLIVKVPFASRAVLIALYFIPLLDCFRDIFGKVSSVKITYDKFYRIKILTSLVTLSLARIIFFVIIRPKTRRMGLAALEREIAAGGQIRGVYYEGHKILAGEMDSYAHKKIKELEEKGELVSSTDVGQEEYQKSHGKAGSALSPKNTG